MTREELIAALEAATEGSEELDAYVLAYKLGATAEKAKPESRFNGRWCLYLPPRTSFDGDRRLAGVIEECGPTRSLDAALKLVPEGFAVRDFIIWPGIPSTLTVLGTHKERDGIYWHHVEDGRWEASGATPALALCIAALKARSTGKESPR